MAIIKYRGQQLKIGTAKDVHDLLQLFGNHLQGLASDLVQLVQDHAQTAEKVKQGGSLSPLSVASMLPSLSARLPAAPAQTPVLPTPTPSPHRNGAPSAVSGDTSLPTVAFSTDSSDRAHVMTLDFTAAYTATNPVASVTFKTPYSSPPVVILQQLDQLAARSFEPITVTKTGYTFICNAFLAGELHLVQAIVIHPSESFD